MDNFEDLKPFLDAAGRLTQWPSPRRGKGMQEMALEYLAAQFELNRRYTEREVNELLNRYHTFGDAALLRRELFERGYIDRLKDGSQYWRLTDHQGLSSGRASSADTLQD